MACRLGRLETIIPGGMPAMNFDLSDEQEMVRDTFARFLDDNSSPAHVRKAIETGTLIHTPTWIREIMGALRRGSKSWADADKARRKAAAKARRAGENAGAAGEQAMRAALAKAEAGSVLRPLDPAEVLAACEEIAGGVSEERGSELLADVLGMDDRQAVAVAA